MEIYSVTPLTHVKTNGDVDWSIEIRQKQQKRLVPLYINLDNGATCGVFTGIHLMVEEEPDLHCSTVVECYDMKSKYGNFNLSLSICQLKCGTLLGETFYMDGGPNEILKKFIPKNRRVALLNLPRR